MTTRINSFAKINFGLRILKKRDDGYHDLETIFYPVKLHDEININIEHSDINSNSVILKSNTSYIPLNKDNLCFKAAEKFFNSFRIKEYYRIEIDIVKNIPIGGGMGGGSSNAVSVIKFFIRYFNIDIEENKETIMNLALSLGSDVPFFFLMKPCYAEGRGEKIKILRDFRIDYDILIVNPNLHISTKWAFEKLNYSPDFSKETLLDKVKIFDPLDKDAFVNDFEKIVFSKYNVLNEIKSEMLNAGAVYSSLSGSGATMFGLFARNKKSTLAKCFNLYKSKRYFTYISS